MTTQHTPTPWKWEDRQGYGGGNSNSPTIWDESSRRWPIAVVKHAHIICTNDYKNENGSVRWGEYEAACRLEKSQVNANATFIVRACNGWNDIESLRVRLQELEAQNGSL